MFALAATEPELPKCFTRPLVVHLAIFPLKYFPDFCVLRNDLSHASTFGLGQARRGVVHFQGAQMCNTSQACLEPQACACDGQRCATLDNTEKIVRATMSFVLRFLNKKNMCLKKFSHVIDTSVAPSS